MVAAVKMGGHEEIMPRYLRGERIYKRDGRFYTVAGMAAQKRRAGKLRGIFSAAGGGGGIAGGGEVERGGGGQ
mgnify:CR=1 FL=1